MVAEAKLPSPQLTVSGTELHRLKDGKEYSSFYDSVDAETTMVKDSEDCSWTSMTARMAPSLSWNHCNGSSGTQKITKTKGSPWPLSTKNKFQYGFRGKRSDSGKPRTSTRKCKVDGQERVEVPAGEFNTYKVVCKDQWNKRTIWVPPELGHGVAFKKKHNTDNSRSYMLELGCFGTPLFLHYATTGLGRFQTEVLQRNNSFRVRCEGPVGQ